MAGVPPYQDGGYGQAHGGPSSSLATSPTLMHNGRGKPNGSGSGGGGGGASGASSYLHHPLPHPHADPRYHPASYPSDEYASHRQHPRPPMLYSNSNSNGGATSERPVSREYNYARPYGQEHGGQPPYNAVDNRREFDSRRTHHSDSTSSHNSAVSVRAASHGSPHSVPGTHPGQGSRDVYNRPPPPTYHQHEANNSPQYRSRREGSGDGAAFQAGTGGSSSTLSANHPDRKVSCLECRSSKVKCSGQAEGGCDRCRRIKRPCVFEQHRRGRKPAQVKIHKLEQSVDTIMTALSALTEYKRNKEAARELEDDDDEESTPPSTSRTRKRRAESDSSTADVVKFAKGRDDSIGSLSGILRREILSPEEDSFANLPRSDRNRSSSMLDGLSGRAHVLSAPRSPSMGDTAVHKLDSGDILGTDSDGASQELGQPPLSNPLKLLAQASDSTLEPARADSIGVTEIKQDLEEGDAHEPYDDEREHFARSQRGGGGVQSKSQRGASRRGYWSIGMYSSRLDKGKALDPIAQNIMTHTVARDLYGLYMRHLNAPITLLDPMLHTFSYVRSHSALLLSASCALAARFAAHIPNAEQIANKLDAHIQELLLPTILLKGYRSVEISQAFIILAAYHSNTQSLDGDRSWSLVGYGIRIAAELDMNARLLSEWSSMGKSATTPASMQADTPSSSKLADDDVRLSVEESTQRRLRNRERTWCNLWLFEYSLSTHMGRRSTLSQDPVILGVSAGWHRAPYAIPGDEAIVALIGLRRIQIKNAEFFEHSILSSSTDVQASNTAALRFQLDFYRNSCSADINSWAAMYVERDEGQSFRMKNASLYASYARLMLHSFALKCTTDQDLLGSFYKESYSAAMTYLTLYSERIKSPGLTYVHNSSVVTVAYVAVFALKLCSLDPERYPYIDSQCVFDHVGELAEALSRAGSVTPWRNGAASSYAPYLAAVLERVQRNSRLEQGRRESGGVTSSHALSHGTQVDQSSTVTENTSEARNEGPSNATDGSASDQMFAAPDSSTPPDNVAVASSRHAPSTQSMALAHAPASGQSPGRYATFPFNSAMPAPQSKFQPEALTFLAGPSGVQAATVLDEFAVNEDYLRFGAPQNMQDHQFLEGSLFGDMSVFLNASVHDHIFPWPASEPNASVPTPSHARTSAAAGNLV